MATNIVTVSGMFGEVNGQIHTYFADSPVVIDIDGLFWGNTVTSPFTIVRVEVVYNDYVVGDFRADTGGQSSISFDISSALRAIWSDINFVGEVQQAQTAATSDDTDEQAYQRSYRLYGLHIYTEYISDGVFTTTMCTDRQGNTLIPGGQCLIGGMTEWERSVITDNSQRDVSHLEKTGVRNGDASTKPTDTPERVGRTSITSWVDVKAGYTKSIFYPPRAYAESDDDPNLPQGWTGHAPLVLRDNVPYTDFLFVNRRGAVETCSARMLEDLSINVESTQYARVQRPTFQPSRSLMAIANGGRRTWAMSSGYQTREWTEWWVLEFLMARQWWMFYKGAFVPVVVQPGKNDTSIYDRTKQEMSHVEFTVTLALEG